MANRIHDTHFPQSSIVDRTGKRYTYKQAATYLDLDYNYFLKRLKNWRARGVYRLSIEFLQAHGRPGRLSNEAKKRALALLPPASYSPPIPQPRSSKPNVHDTCRRPEIPAQRT